MRSKQVRSISILVLIAAAVVMPCVAAEAKGGPTDATRLFVRTSERGVTMRVYESNGLEYGISGPGSCSGPGCPPPECVPRGALVIGFSTKRAVGQGWAQVYARGERELQQIGAGGFGFEFDESAAYVVAQTGDGVDLVRVKFRGGGSDEMRPTNHLVVLAAPIRAPDVTMYNFQGPSGVLEAFDADGRRVARQRFAPTTFTGGPPKECLGGLEDEFPEPTGEPPVDEPAARYEIIAAFATAYGPGLEIDERAALVEDGGALLTVMNIAADKNPTYRDQITAPVDEVQFIDGTHAAVRFSLVISGGPVISGIGRSVFVEGQWLVSRRTYCGLQQLGGVWCPSADKGD